jgi:hypothetical protein
MRKFSQNTNNDQSKNLKQSKVTTFESNYVNFHSSLKTSFFNLDKETSYDETNVVYDNLKYDCLTLEKSLEEKIKESKELNCSNNKLKSNIFLLEKEQEIFQQELNILDEKFKDCNWKINKDLCGKFLSCEKYNKPNNSINLISETFLFIFRFKDTSWNSFIELIKNFTKLKNLMSNFSSNNLEDDEINKLMELWKSKENFENALIGKCPEICLILNWLIQLLESKIKTNSLNNSKDKYYELKTLMSNNNNKLRDINSEIISLKIKIKNLKLKIENCREKIKYVDPIFETCETKYQQLTLEKDISSIKPNQGLLILKNIEDNKIQNSLLKNKINRKILNVAVHQKNDSTLDGNTQSYEMDENYAVIKNSSFKKQTNPLDKDEDDSFIIKTIKEIKLDMLSSEEARKPLPSQKIKVTPIKPKNVKKNFINQLPNFETKNNHKVLNNPEYEDNLANSSNFPSERLSVNNKSDNEKIIIPLSARGIMEDETSQFSKNLKFSPNNSIFKRSLMSQIEPIMIDFKNLKPEDKNQIRIPENKKNENSCSKHFTNIFC